MFELISNIILGGFLIFFIVAIGCAIYTDIKHHKGNK